MKQGRQYGYGASFRNKSSPRIRNRSNRDRRNLYCILVRILPNTLLGSRRRFSLMNIFHISGLALIICMISIMGPVSADEKGCVVPKPNGDPICYDIVGPPLEVIFRRHGAPIWQGLIPEKPYPRFVFLFQNESCWMLGEYKAGTQEYCITKGGPSREQLRRDANQPAPGSR